MAENTQVATQKQSFSVVLTGKLDSVAEALPKDFNRSRFVQNALALINDNPQLQKYSQSQLMAGLMKGAYLGLDFYSKECYLVPYGNQLNYQTDYRGAKKLAKKYSIRPITDIYAKLVREGDFLRKLLKMENRRSLSNQNHLMMENHWSVCGSPLQRWRNVLRNNDPLGP